MRAAVHFRIGRLAKAHEIPREFSGACLTDQKPNYYQDGNLAIIRSAEPYFSMPQ